MKKRIKTFAVVLLLFAPGIEIMAQPVTFSKVICPDSCVALAYEVVSTPDNCFIIAGDDQMDGLIFKMDNSGDTVWSVKHAQSTAIGFYTIAPTHDSCYILAGRYNTDKYIVKIKPDGDTLWTETINTGNAEHAYSVEETYDRGIIVAGITFMSSAPAVRIAVTKLDSAGNLTWSNLYVAGNYENYAMSIKQTPDSGYILAGTVQNSQLSNTAACLVKLTSTGSVSWSKTYNDSVAGMSHVHDMIITDDGYLALLSIRDYVTAIMKTDFSGNVMWARYYDAITGGIPLYGNLSPRMFAASDSTILFSNGEDFGVGSVVWKIDYSGNTLWSQNVYCNIHDQAESGDGGYIMVGNGPLQAIKSHDKGGQPQMGIIKTDSLGNAPFCTYSNMVTGLSLTITATPVTFSTSVAGTVQHAHASVTRITPQISGGCVSAVGSVAENKDEDDYPEVYPNPTSGVFRIAMNPGNGAVFSGLSVYNVMGVMVYHASGALYPPLLVDMGSFPDGIYYLQSTSGENIFARKIIICH